MVLRRTRTAIGTTTIDVRNNAATIQVPVHDMKRHSTSNCCCRLLGKGRSRGKHVVLTSCIFCARKLTYFIPLWLSSPSIKGSELVTPKGRLLSCHQPNKESQLVIDVHLETVIRIGFVSKIVTFLPLYLRRQVCHLTYPLAPMHTSDAPSGSVISLCTHQLVHLYFRITNMKLYIQLRREKKKMNRTLRYRLVLHACAFRIKRLSCHGMR